MSARVRTAGLTLISIVLALAGGQAASDGRAAEQQVVVTAGKSTVVTTVFDLVRIAITNPAVADAVVVQPREILVDGKSPGRVSLIAWGQNGRVQYEIVVQGPATDLERHVQTLFPNEQVRVTANDETVVLSGTVTSAAAAARLEEVVKAAVPGARVVSLLQAPAEAAAQQVMLEVRFAEVNRRALTELGAAFFTGPSGVGDWVGRVTTQQFAAPNFEGGIGPTASASDGQTTFSDFLNLFVFNTEENIGALIRALKARGFFQSLAEPNLIAANGQEASFLAGGEIPVPIVQGLGGAVSVAYKEFGIRLTFTPVITGSIIRLRVRPEVSALDFTNGITLQGFRIPALSTRRAETQVELRDGQSFAIAGLIDNISQDDQARVPGLGDIPILGQLFRSRATRQERTELLVIITPRLVRPQDGVAPPPLPIDTTRFLPPPADAR